MTADEIQTLLHAALPGAQVRIVDDSARHAGHGAAGGHYNLTIVWEGFATMNRLARQRHTHGILAGPLQAGRIHALQLTLRTPAELA